MVMIYFSYASPPLSFPWKGELAERQLHKKWKSTSSFTRGCAFCAFKRRREVSSQHLINYKYCLNDCFILSITDISQSNWDFHWFLSLKFTFFFVRIRLALRCGNSRQSKVNPELVWMVFLFFNRERNKSLSSLIYNSTSNSFRLWICDTEM